MNPYEELANAIVLQAAKDFVPTYRAWQRYKAIDTKKMDEKRKKRYDVKLKKPKKEFDEVQHFFGSDWYYSLTSVDHRLILKKLNKEAGIE